MGIINMVRNIKQFHLEDIILIKIGKFYYSYGKDAYILSYLFNYKLNKIEEFNTYSVGFPKTSLAKVTAKLENIKINYIIVDRRNNYEVDQSFDNGNLNTYQVHFKKAIKSSEIKIRLSKIVKLVLKNINDIDMEDKMDRVERVIYETREI